jgi:DNA-binding response OmpR family regulator
MKILIVEDDDEKAKQLEIFACEFIPSPDVSIARSLQTGLRLALSEEWDLMLLDMTMTTFDRTLNDDGGRPHPFAGREILRRMKREGIAIPVVIVTQFDRFGEEAEELTLKQLEIELKENFLEFRGIVRYRANVDDWKSQLEGAVQDIVEKFADGE